MVATQLALTPRAHCLQLISTVGSLLRKFGDEVMPLVETMIKTHFNAMLTEAGRGPEERWAALMLLTDVIEFAPSSVRYLPSLLPKLLEFSASEHVESCNTAIYTLGVIAEVHPAVRISLLPWGSPPPFSFF